MQQFDLSRWRRLTPIVAAVVSFVLIAATFAVMPVTATAGVSVEAVNFERLPGEEASVVEVLLADTNLMRSKAGTQ